MIYIIARRTLRKTLFGVWILEFIVSTITDFKTFM